MDKHKYKLNEKDKYRISFVSIIPGKFLYKSHQTDTNFHQVNPLIISKMVKYNRINLFV